MQQGVPGDADAVWGTVCPGRGAGDPAWGAGNPSTIPFFCQGRRRRRETRSACARHACFLRPGQQPGQYKTGGMSARYLNSYDQKSKINIKQQGECGWRFPRDRTMSRSLKTPLTIWVAIASFISQKAFSTQPILVSIVTICVKSTVPISHH